MSMTLSIGNLSMSKEVVAIGILLVIIALFVGQAMIQGSPVSQSIGSSYQYSSSHESFASDIDPELKYFFPWLPIQTAQYIATYVAYFGIWAAVALFPYLAPVAIALVSLAAQIGMIAA
jgi:hypothetical protein